MTQQQITELRALLKTALEVLSKMDGAGGDSRTPSPIAPDGPTPASEPEASHAD